LSSDFIQILDILNHNVWWNYSKVPLLKFLMLPRTTTVWHVNDIDDQMLLHLLNYQIILQNDFNASVQADALWIKLPETKAPILSIVDSTTKFQAGVVICGDRSSDFIHALVRGWMRHFGPQNGD